MTASIRRILTALSIALLGLGSMPLRAQLLPPILPPLPGGDTTSPTVRITAPQSGSTVFGRINVTATATDNAGVAGVQFQLDSVDSGAEDVAGPYAISWDTNTAAVGSHTITAVARDAAGNRTTSEPVTVTVVNPPRPPSAARNRMRR
jgi:hypothetical protein